MGNHFNAAAWTCPSDSGVHQADGQPTSYPYSYSMNLLLSDRLNWIFGDPSKSGTSLAPSAQYLQLMNGGGSAAKLVRIRHSSEVVMMIEEDESTLDDGETTLVDFSAAASAP